MNMNTLAIPVEEFLINPTKVLVRKLIEGFYTSVGDRINNIDKIISEFEITISPLKKENIYTDNLEKFFMLLRKYFDPTTIKDGDFNNFYSLPNLVIRDFDDFEIIKNRYIKLTENKFCSKNFAFSVYGKCKECKNPIEISYIQYKSYINSKDKKKQLQNICNKCRSIEAYTKIIHSVSIYTGSYRKDTGEKLRILKEGGEEFLPISYLDRV